MKRMTIGFPLALSLGVGATAVSSSQTATAGPSGLVSFKVVHDSILFPPATILLVPASTTEAERFIQTLLREWAYRVPYRSSARRTAALGPYLRFYNHRRPHTSLGRRSPWMRFQEAA